MTGPEPIESLVDYARRTRDALERATAPLPAPPPEDEAPAQRFTRTMNEQAERERRDAELERRVAYENPHAPSREALDDPLRAAYAESRARGRRRRRRLPR